MDLFLVGRLSSKLLRISLTRTCGGDSSIRLWLSTQHPKAVPFRNVTSKCIIFYKFLENVQRRRQVLQFYITDSELFNILHLAIGCGQHDRMLKELSCKFKNITCHDNWALHSSFVNCARKKKFKNLFWWMLHVFFFPDFNIHCEVNLTKLPQWDGFIPCQSLSSKPLRISLTRTVNEETICD